MLIKIDEKSLKAFLKSSKQELETAMSDGLEDVVAADTVLSDVDGKAGHLVIRGYTLDELAGRTTYEEVTHLLWDGFFDALPGDLAPALGAARAEVFAEVSALDTGLLDRTPIEAIRALTARLADGDDLEIGRASCRERVSCCV